MKNKGLLTGNRLLALAAVAFIIIAAFAVWRISSLSQSYAPPAPEKGIYLQQGEAAPPAAECAGNETRQCEVNGCAGRQACQYSAWGVCSFSKVCVPGERISCSLNGCSFGYRVCNDCGSGFGDCLAPGVQGACNNGNCS